MHPELLRALAKARPDDLLHDRRSRGQPMARLDDRSAWFPRSRQRLGAVLIRTGTRVIGDQGAALELAHK